MTDKSIRMRHPLTLFALISLFAYPVSAAPFESDEALTKCKLFASKVAELIVEIPDLSADGLSERVKTAMAAIEPGAQDVAWPSEADERTCSERIAPLLKILLAELAKSAFKDAFKLDGESKDQPASDEEKFAWQRIGGSYGHVTAAVKSAETVKSSPAAYFAVTCSVPSPQENTFLAFAVLSLYYDSIVSSTQVTFTLSDGESVGVPADNSSFNEVVIGDEITRQMVSAILSTPANFTAQVQTRDGPKTFTFSARGAERELAPFVDRCLPK